VPTEQRDALRTHLSEAGVDTGVHWRPAHHHAFFRQFRCGPLPVTERAARELISLPLHSAPMADATIDRICDLVTGFLR
jgi:dTDP-4-amino-4,6-dideoxygalactose transaminase